VTTFVDTNVFLYALDERQGGRHVTAARILEELWETRQGVVSTQVLQEVYVNLSRKLAKPMTRSRARAVIERYATWPVHHITAEDILSASELEQRHTLAFWDALLVVAAQHLRADRLLTEDMQSGRPFGRLRIENPFQT